MRSHTLHRVLVGTVLLVSCGDTGDAGDGSGGRAGTGGTTGSGGATQGTGGAPGTGGSSVGSGGSGSGGSGAGTGGANGSGGASGTAGMSGASGGASGGAGRAGGEGGGAAGRGGGGRSGGVGGGPAGTGGRTGAGGMNTGGTTGGSGGASGTCTKGQTKGSEVVFIGDSFIQMSSIPETVTSYARAAGAIGQNESYRDLSVSGSTLQGNNQIPSQYDRAVAASAVKVVLMDGGGNDCLQRNDAMGAYTAGMALLQKMAQNNTETVVYLFYPDPLKGLASGSLKTCLDTLRPQMKSFCDGLAKPKCVFVDLRPGWNDSHVVNDGIHPSEAGSKFVADKAWMTMQQNCIAQ